MRSDFLKITQLLLDVHKVSKPQELVMDREDGRAAVHGVANPRTLSNMCVQHFYKMDSSPEAYGD